MSDFQYNVNDFYTLEAFCEAAQRAIENDREVYPED